MFCIRSIIASTRWNRGLGITKRIKGLMLLLTIALQAITLIEFVARRNLAATNRTISGLVPGNPKMKTNRPTTERLLAQFEGLHLLIGHPPTQIKLRLIEELNPLQIEILAAQYVPNNLQPLVAQRKIPRLKLI